MTISIISSMSTRDILINYIKKKKAATGNELTKLLKISRQALNKHLKELINEGKVIREGTTKGVKYYHADSKKIPLQKFRKTYLLRNLKEHIVFKELDLSLQLQKKLKKNIFDIIQYTFAKILNNAIEHSHSKKCFIEAVLEPYKISYIIRDYGIGIFYSISKKFGFSDENEALGELTKGKITTMPERHTGEGVFFTSKAADNVNFRSHNINLIFNNVKKDTFVEEKKSIQGTQIGFEIGKNSRRILADIFNSYAPEEFEYKFQKTKVLVKLFQDKYFSRSEAKRLITGLDKFKELLLDFQGVKSISRSFADEIFRVFQNEHPDIVIKIQNIRPSLQAIINHMVDNKI